MNVTDYINTALDRNKLCFIGAVGLLHGFRHLKSRPLPAILHHVGLESSAVKLLGILEAGDNSCRLKMKCLRPSFP